jgi:hypothetical protein
VKFYLQNNGRSDYYYNSESFNKTSYKCLRPSQLVGIIDGMFHLIEKPTKFPNLFRQKMSALYAADSYVQIRQFLQDALKIYQEFKNTSFHGLVRDLEEGRMNHYRVTNKIHAEPMKIFDLFL